jgi:hypothetical protein
LVPTSGAKDDAIQQSGAACVTAHTVAATEVTVADVRSLMYNTASYTPAQAVGVINEAPCDVALPIGGITPGATGRYRDAILSEIDAAIPEIFHVQVTAPASDQALAVGQVAVLGTINGVVHPVPPTEGFGG